MHAGGLAKVLAPIISLALAFSQHGPAPLFARLHSMAHILVKGMSLEWLPLSDRAGTVRFRVGERVPEISWLPWEGILTYAYEAAKVVGTVDPARLLPDGLGCEIDVKWKLASGDPTL